MASRRSLPRRDRDQSPCDRAGFGAPWTATSVRHEACFIGGHEEDTVKTQGGHEEDTVKTQGGHEEDTVKTQGGHEEVTVKTQGGHEVVTVEIR
jgi:hypothetical protein